MLCFHFVPSKVQQNKHIWKTCECKAVTCVCVKYWRAVNQDPGYLIPLRNEPQRGEHIKSSLLFVDLCGLFCPSTPLPKKVAWKHHTVVSFHSVTDCI